MRTRVDGHVLRLELDRPQKRNALDLATIAALRAASAPPAGVRVVRLSAEGPVWCAGADLASLATHPGGAGAAMHEYADALADLVACPVPLVALVDGSVLGGGVGLLCCADVVVAGPAASVALPEARVGLWPMMVGALLGRVASPRVAMELAVTGRTVGAQEAVSLGLFSRYLPSPAEAAAAADEACASVVARSPHAVREGRAAWRRSAGLESSELRPRLHALADDLAALGAHADAAEGIAAFFEKREPRWAD